ncbi:hypothetical protein CGCVW01_v014396, partial [Colletotrichum viniferum]
LSLENLARCCLLSNPSTAAARRVKQTAQPSLTVPSSSVHWMVGGAAISFTHEIFRRH